MRVDLAMVLVAVGVAALAARPADESQAGKLVGSMHQYYKGQFENLEMVAGGLFGTSRIESGSIEMHTRSGGDPGYRSKEYSTSVNIYGAHGNPLTPDNLEHRYHRSANGGDPGALLRSEAAAKFDPMKFAAEAVRGWKGGDFKGRVEMAGTTRFEARPILLSKRECLSCHTKSKQGEPVAVMVYRLQPFEKIKG